MPTLLKNILKYSIILSIMAFLLYQTIMDIDEKVLEEGQSRLAFIYSYWLKSDKFFMFFSAFLAITSHVIRALRWKILLEPLGYNNISVFNSTNAVFNGYFINLFIPRGGELSRPLTLERTDNVPTDIGVGTVVTERIIDLIFLVICLGSVFIFQADTIIQFVTEGWNNSKNNAGTDDSIPWFKLILLAGVVIGIIGIIVIYFLKPQLFQTLKEKGLSFLKGMKTGLLSIFKLEKRALFIIYSLVIWVFYYLMLYTVFLAFQETSHINAQDALTAFVVGGIAMALPSPGGTGTYHFMVSYVLRNLCAVAANPAIAIVTVFHGFHTLLLIIIGGIGTFFIPNNKSK